MAKRKNASRNQDKNTSSKFSKTVRHNFEVGDFVTSYTPFLSHEIIAVNATHLHLRNSTGSTWWEPVEKCTKVDWKFNDYR